MRFLQLRMSFYFNQLFSCYYRFLWLNMQRSNPCLNQNLIFFLFDFCLYTSFWHKRGKSNLFSIIAMQIIAPSTPQTLSEGWYSSHQERDRGQVNVLICAAPCCPSGHGPVPCPAFLATYASIQCFFLHLYIHAFINIRNFNYWKYVLFKNRVLTCVISSSIWGITSTYLSISLYGNDS